MTNLAQERINQKIEEIKSRVGAGIVDLLIETNQTRLQGKGQVTASPLVDPNGLRWTLAWTEAQIKYELNIYVHITDDGRRADVGKVWVHRRAATPMDFEGHTPTTRMRRVASLSIPEIRAAIEAEWR